MAHRSLLKQMAHWRPILACLAIMAALMTASSIPAEARRHHHGHHRHAFHHHSAHYRVAHHRRHYGRHAFHWRHGRHHHLAGRAASGENFVGSEHSGFAAIVVDGNSGRTLFARNEHELRHPASVTKVMTLYLLFEQLEKGKLRLDSPLMISQHAAAQAPSKLGLEPGDTIDVENAIKAVVTKSANDIAVAIAENIGGDEDAFADMMTRKAHALGMSHTHYANASGLPNAAQITTAHDLAVLGRAIQDRFPRYYRYFSTHQFSYRGGVHRNHNHLLGRVEGVDGIKTGYTRASGFNLLSSVRRGGHHIVAVVLGGRSGGARDRIMAGLIEDHIGSGSSSRTARAITEDEPAEAPAAAQQAAAEPADPQNDDEAEVAPEPRQAPRPVALISRPAPAPARDVAADKARPAFVPGVQKRVDETPTGRRSKRGKSGEEARAPVVDGSTSRAAGLGSKSAPRREAAATTPSSLRHSDANRSQIQKAEMGRPARAGWMIQIGATGDADEAAQLLNRAHGPMRGIAAGAKAFTEKVQKGGETLYRARFAGLDEQSAESACKTLKRSGFACFTTRN